VWGQVRAVIAGVVGGLLITAYSIWIGTKDTLTLTVRAIVAVVIVWVLAEILQTQRVRSRLPLVWVGFGSEGRKLAKESDEALASRIDAVVKGIADLMATHLRYQPDFHAGPDLEEWQKQTDRRTRHERDTAARFFEEYGGEIVDVSEALKRRSVLTEEEYRTLVWTLQTAGHGLTHELPRVAAQLAAASRKLRGLD
jgi:hypothetical protein